MAPLYRIADGLRYRRHGDLGQHGEDLAHRYLRRNGFTVVARNWRPPQGGGEIDIVAGEGDWLVFVEVKTRAADSLSAPERAIDSDKMIALRRAARDVTPGGRAPKNRRSLLTQSRSPAANWNIFVTHLRDGSFDSG